MKWLTLVISIIWFGCVGNKKDLSPVDLRILKLNADSLQKISNQVASPLLKSDWQKEYASYIENNNPEFFVELPDSLSYRFIPILVISKENLKDNKNNIKGLLSIGKFEINNSRIYIACNHKPIGIFVVNSIITKGNNSPNRNLNRKIFFYRPETFHKTLPESKVLDIVDKSDFYFNIGIKTKNGMFFIPELVNYTENRLMIFNQSKGINYPIEDYNLWEFPGNILF